MSFAGAGVAALEALALLVVVGVPFCAMEGCGALLPDDCAALLFDEAACSEGEEQAAINITARMGIKQSFLRVFIVK